MTHEPECSENSWIWYCICDELRSAYQRGYASGKQDERSYWNNPCCFCGSDSWSTYVCDTCVEEHNKLSYYYDVHIPECEDEYCGGCIPIHPDDLRDMNK